MPRTICPQVSGIYQNNNVDDDYPYQYLYIPENHPDSEYWAIDAFECKKFGDLNPEKKCPEPHVALDFGDYVEF
jgi:hypothetical protein